MKASLEGSLCTKASREQLVTATSPEKTGHWEGCALRSYGEKQLRGNYWDEKTCGSRLTKKFGSPILAASFKKVFLKSTMDLNSITRSLGFGV